MRQQLTLLLSTFLILFSAGVHAQKEVNFADPKISLITVGPGKNLYDKFGHTGIRLQDGDLDIVFNYGSYDFDTPNFYLKFAQGQMMYKVTTNYFESFLNFYKGENRWVKEQVLLLSPEEKSKMMDFLRENIKPENSRYRYDFFYDNCATKPRDVIFKGRESLVTIDESYASDGLTFRQLIQQNVHWNTWGSMGMDLGIGAVTDRVATAWEYQFLPEYVSQAVAGAQMTVDGREVPLAGASRMLFENEPVEDGANFLLSPLLLFILIGGLIIWVTWKDTSNGRRSRWLDISIMGLTGIVGVILMLLWFATEHSTTANNYNLLWASPLSLIALWPLTKMQPPRWCRRYIAFLLLMGVLMIIHWLTGVQEFALSLIPLFLALGYRYLYLFLVLPK
ncbi:DUF4105 domain-containing protein [Aureitalea marina]|uniref:Uncharacterized protein n=1 Tax=Aureitalea marina TaxID=930804 RepID=A0A2S7KMS3_9FLAO|nr:DUF4105 domain-containing protein [Aureitalea marina]PQB03898.1 hypothetical protein BST85_02480 [Aureitalea marina]